MRKIAPRTVAMSRQTCPQLRRPTLHSRKPAPARRPLRCDSCRRWVMPYYAITPRIRTFSGRTRAASAPRRRPPSPRLPRATRSGSIRRTIASRCRTCRAPMPLPRALTLLRFELALSAKVLTYVLDATRGRIDPNRLSGYHDLPRKSVDLGRCARRHRAVFRRRGVSRAAATRTILQFRALVAELARAAATARRQGPRSCVSRWSSCAGFRASSAPVTCS